MYVLVDDANNIKEYPYDLHNLIKRYPNVSFPQNLSEINLDKYNVKKVVEVLRPLTSSLEVLEDAHPVFDETTQTWVQQWHIRELLPEEINTRNESIKQDIIFNVQTRLDEFAKIRGYDNMLSLCTYATDQTTKFSVEGKYGVLVRGQTWAKLYEILEEVNSGTRPMPERYQDIEPLLPILEWPN